MNDHEKGIAIRSFTVGLAVALAILLLARL